MTRVKVLDIDPASYQRHGLHAEDRLWVEKNCYVDIWLELIHALGGEPRAVLPFAVAIDFDGGQFTFYKPPHDELRDLYGVDVQEMNVWKPLVEHAQELLGAGRMISTEADAFFLPDTAGTDYQRNHVKTTIVLNDLDVEARRLGYFHNAAYHWMEGEDFVRTFRIGVERDPTFMPLFAESVRIDRLVVRPEAELVGKSRALWKRHLGRRPATNPIERFGARFQADLPTMQARGLDYYHAFAFGTLRQLGSAFELCAQNLRWLDGAGVTDLADGIAAFETVSSTAKTFILKAARAVNAKRALDAAPVFAEMAAAWQRGVDVAIAQFGE
ncbi:MAG: DUF1839 family protein [Deltaproteobacteria bacterium]|nr:DUF1839 family protein [Deltaproteobacteria bacterium]